MANTAKTKQHDGQHLRLTYPAFLKVKMLEPKWSAFAPKQTGAIVITLDPPPPIAQAFQRLLKNPDFTRVPGAIIVREGPFASPHSLEGWERVTELNEIMGWMIDGTLGKRRAINIQIWSTKPVWADGTVWKELVDSIELVGEN